MRHLRNFEDEQLEKEAFCLFIAPRIHNDTFSTFWYAVKYEYNGRPQKIVPMNIEVFARLLQIVSEIIESKRPFYHNDLQDFFAKTVLQTKKLTGFSKWAESIPISLENWRVKFSDNHEI